jgi:peptide/nickel transport system substrate-binding protein
MKRLLIPMIVLLLVIFVVSGCGTTSSTTTPPAVTTTTAAAAPTTSKIPATTAAATTTASTTIPITSAAATPTPTGIQQYGGDLKMLLAPTFLNLGYPQIPVPAFNPFQICGCIENLMRCDDQGNPSPFLCESWKIVDDKTLTLNLRKGVKFHDGNDFDANSVKWCLDTIQKLQPAELDTMQSVEVVDTYTLKITFRVHDNLMADYFMFKPGNMISPAGVQKNGQDWAIINPIGTGPFKFTGFQRDVYIRLGQKNTDYWQKGKPYVNSYENILVADVMTRKNAFLSGTAQIIDGITPRDADELQKKGYQIISAPFLIFFIAGDSANPDSPFANLKVRQAVSYAIDNKGIADTFGYGFWKTTNQLSYPGHSMYNPDIKGYPYDVAKAKALLTEAGFPNGFQMTLSYTSGGMNDVYTLIQSYLGKVGINVKLEIVDVGRSQDLSTKGWKNGIINASPYMAFGYPGIKTLNFYFSPRAVGGKSIIRPDEVEKLYQEASTAPTRDAMIAKTKEINRLLIDTYCVGTPIFIQPAMGAKIPSLKDDRIYNPLQDTWTPANAWLEQK